MTGNLLSDKVSMAEIDFLDMRRHLIPAAFKWLLTKSGWTNQKRGGKDK